MLTAWAAAQALRSIRQRLSIDPAGLGPGFRAVFFFFFGGGVWLFFGFRVKGLGI